MKKKIYIISLILLFLDQVSKIIVLKYLNYGESIEIINNLFSLTLLKNTGGAFSILSGNVFLLSVIGLVVLGGACFYIKKENITSKIESISISLILGGLVGNLIDRIFRGGVIDFLDFRIFGYSYPVFNLADIFLVVGVVLYIYEEVVIKDEMRKRWNKA